MDDLLRHELENTSPKQAATTALALCVGEKYGREAMYLVRELLREQQIDPTSPDFDKQSFLRQVAEKVKAQPTA